MSDCIFCNIASGKIGAQVVYQDQSVVAFRDLNPQAPVHILVIPKKHVERLSAVEGGDLPLIGEIHRAIQMIVQQEKIGESGFRVVTNDGINGGQTVAHLHYHVLGGRRMTWPPG